MATDNMLHCLLDNVRFEISTEQDRDQRAKRLPLNRLLKRPKTSLLR